MESLDDYRKRIDEIDQKLEALFEERLTISEKIGRYKIERQLELFQSSREIEVIKKAKNRLNNQAYKEEMETFFIALMEISKTLQRKLLPTPKEEEPQTWAKVGYQGIPGSFSEEAATLIYGNDVAKNHYDTFEALFQAIADGEIDEGVLPMENSSTGAIAQVYDLLLQYGFYITGERTLRIQQNLLALPGSRIEEIKAVYSHPQGFAQSSLFLQKYPQWHQIPYYNTATAAKHIHDLGSREKAAIAGSRAASLYDLEIIAENIQNNQDNYTRFIIIKKTSSPCENADKASIVLSLEDEAGHLNQLLQVFAENGINLVKIESRPMKNRPWKYFLYLDFEGEFFSANAQKALEEIKNKAGFFQLLGAYQGEKQELFPV